MRKLIFTAFSAFVIFICNAQNNSGEIVYEVTFGNDVKTYKLVFNADKAKYSSADNSASNEKDYYFSSSTKYYSGKKSASNYEIAEMTLGEGVTNVVNYNETKKIAGLTCKKVSFKNIRGNEYTVWYTTDFGVKASPVPGLWTNGVVMAVESPKLNVTARSVNYIEVKNESIVYPANSKLVQKDEPGKTNTLRQ